MMYSESVTITSGVKCGMAWMAVIVATSSPIWLKCLFPGVCIALFLWSSWLNHIPASLWAFCLLLLKHTPSVYILTLLWRLFVACITCLCAGFFAILSGSVKIWKHSARFFLLVSVGLNSTVCLRC